MALRLKGYIALPPHVKKGGFDHADIHQGSGRLYVAHTANDAIDVIDCSHEKYLYSIPNLTGVAGVLVSNETGLVFSTNRGEDAVAIFTPGNDRTISTVPVGPRPNGLAYDAQNNLLLAADLGKSEEPTSASVTIIDVETKRPIEPVAMPGPTRWAIFDPVSQSFFVNIQKPAAIIVIGSARPNQISRTIKLPVDGPHGLAIDPVARRLFCACDGKKLVTMSADTGQISSEMSLSGMPDVTWFNSSLNRVYVAVADPGVIDVFDIAGMKHLETVETEPGAKTTAFDGATNRVFVFLPQTHRTAIYTDH